MTSKTCSRSAVAPFRILLWGLIGFLLLPAAVEAASIVRGSYVKASNTGTGDRFGYSVALSGALMVVGAPYEASNAKGIDGSGNNDLAPASGAVYVFVRQGDFWLQQAYLKASDAEPGDHFGRSVAVSGETVVVGAPWKGGNAGAAYVFVRTGDTWSQQAILKGSDTAAGDHFGESVAVSGDTAAVGASVKNTETGAVYVFNRSGTAWAQQGSPLQASNAEVYDRFGYSLGLSGDTLVVGAYGEDGNGTAEADNSSLEAGAAYVFVRTGSTWAQQAYLKASTPDAGDYFGESAAISGETIILGASGDSSGDNQIDGDETDNSASRAGAAYVFVRDGATWTRQAYLKASNAEEDDRFGQAVAINKDKVLVGAWGEASGAVGVDGNQGDNSAPQAGAAYVFTRSGAAWSQEAYLKPFNTEAADYFGYAVAVGDKAFAVGAYGEDSSATGIDGNMNDDNANLAGAVYLFHYPNIYLPLIFK